MAQLLFWIYLFNTGVLLNHSFNEVFWQQNPDWSKNQLAKSRYLLMQLSLVFVLIYGYLILTNRLSENPATLMIFGIGSFIGIIHYLLTVKGRRKTGQLLTKAGIYVIFLVINFPLYFLAEEGLLLLKDNHSSGFLFSFLWAVGGIILINVNKRSFLEKKYKTKYILFTAIITLQMCLSLCLIVRNLVLQTPDMPEPISSW